MTKKDFFRLVLKIFGLYSLLISVFSVLPRNLSAFFYEFEWTVFLLDLAILIINFGIFFVLLFNTDSIIKFLRLDEGFDEEKIEIGGLNNQSIFKFAIIIIGGFLIIDYLPSFLFDVVNYFKYKSSGYSFEGEKVDYYSITVSFINVLIGYLLITNYKSIANLLDKK
jgi:hypothetical protein